MQALDKAKTEEFLRSYRTYLGKNKLKYTPQRNAIITAFLGAGGHVSVDDLLAIVRKKHPSAGISLASVYRTVSSLVEANLAVERRFLDKASVFELHMPGTHHDHLICVRCRKIFEFENTRIEHLQEEVAKKLGFHLVDHKLELYGHCNRTNCPNL